MTGPILFSSGNAKGQIAQPIVFPRVDTIWLAENFPSSKAGTFFPGGYAGIDPVRTQYRMRDWSSQRATDIAALVAPDTNPFYLMRAGGLSLTALVSNVLASGFSLFGPTLGHTYGGLFIGPGNNPLVRNVKIYGIQGKLNGPPEETGSLVGWGWINGKIENVTLDGRNAAGVPIASSPLMLSACRDTVINNLTTGFAAYGFAAALWRMQGTTTFNDTVFTDSRKFINIEQADPNTAFVFNRPVLGKTTGANYICQISTRNMGRATLTFNDPVGTGPIPVKVYTSAANPTAGGNGMQDSDIKVIVNGVDVTASRLVLIH